jgi:hypothetical protein
VLEDQGLDVDALVFKSHGDDVRDSAAFVECRTNEAANPGTGAEKGEYSLEGVSMGVWEGVAMNCGRLLPLWTPHAVRLWVFHDLAEPTRTLRPDNDHPYGIAAHRASLLFL